MTLTIVAGLPGSGTAATVMDELTRAAGGGRSAVIVYPSADQATSARDQITASAPVGISAGTLDGILQREWSLHGDGRRIAPAFAADVLAARALSRAGAGDARGPGAVALLRTISSRQAGLGDLKPHSATGLAGLLIDSLMSYQQLLKEHGLVETEEVARRLADSPPPAATIGIVGFSSFDPARERLVAAWSRSADVFLELPWRSGHLGTSGVEPLVERLIAAGAIVRECARVPDDRPDELARIAEHLFSAPEPGAPRGDVRFGVAQGEEGEARLVAELVAETLATGAAPESIAIAFPDLARHTGWMLHALRDAGIATVADLDRGMKEVPFGRALLRLWQFLTHGMAREDLTAFLRSPFSGLALGDADRADFDARRAGTAGGPGLLALTGSAMPLLKRSRRMASEPLTGATAEQWRLLAARLLANAYPGDAPLLSTEALADAAAHREFGRLLEQSLVLGDGVVTMDELMTAYAVARVRTKAVPTRGAVLLTSLSGLPGRDFDHVVIGGLTASEIPRRGAEERMQGDAVGRVAGLLGIEVDPEQHAREERLAFYRAVTAARSSLALVRRSSDDEGAALRESVFWDEFLDLYRAPGAQPTPDELPVRGAAASDTRVGGPRPDRGALLDARALEDLRAVGAVSASAIERYAACPYRWFVEWKLSPESPDAVFDRREAGTLAHEILKAVHPRLADLGGRVTRDNLDAVLEIARECYLRECALAPAPSDLEQRRLQADVWPAVERMLRADVDFLPGFVPIAAEWDFGRGEANEPADLGGLLLKGRVDRIDRGPDGIVVTDYKLSSARSRKEIGELGLVQLQLYSAVAAQRLEAPILGGVYRSLKTGEARGFISREHGAGFKANDLASADEIAAIIENALATARDAVAGMRAGCIEPRPSKESCAYCAAASFCKEAVS